MLDDNIDVLNAEAIANGKGFIFLKNDIGQICAINSQTGETQNKIDGLNFIGTKRTYFTKKTIRNVKFKGGWAKGTIYHEYGHSLYLDDPITYYYGIKYGGKNYYRHTKKMISSPYYFYEPFLDLY